MPKTTIDDGLYQRAAAAAEKAGYSNVDELIKTAIENEVKRIGEDLDEQQVADQLRGLGYIE
ncbi:hypothetical protein [Aeoliella mucimassa]|uniref:Uncharacterized protein n=1 Tax=Aeoliella mucimassa TaxID=2527972 RepID=A0A518AN08_9BACT|nr:hypothetical protein [Aeoliella mucimassa]QDU56119.1 hypothetical protein Pan181_23230 [Aeoliella mucimassa]